MRFSASLLIAVLAGCSDPPAPPPPAPLPPLAPIVAPRSVATPRAIDLVASGGQAFLAWGVPAAAGGGVRLIELGPGGAARGAEVDIASPGGAQGVSSDEGPLQIAELSMSAAAGHLGIAWVFAVRDESIVEAVYASAPGAFAAPRELSRFERDTAIARGNVVVWGGADGALWVTHRIPRRACVASEGECTRFTRARLDTPGGGRGDEPLEIASPCTPLLPGALTASGRTYYAVCHDEPSPATTVYVIDPSVSYAAAAEVLPGCAPIALAPGGASVVLRAHCADGDAVARIAESGRVPTTVMNATFTPRCDQGRPTLTIGANAELALPLTGSESRLEAWLPENVAPAGSRAAWTGEALLVAVPLAGEVHMRRFECVDGTFTRTDVR